MIEIIKILHDVTKIRNFCIIAHIDHGKSTLSDRMLEITGTKTEREMKGKEQVLDMLELEQEKGITIKLTPARMSWKGFELNLIDTPGHVDFRYEVSRSLAACDGAILLVDATQGIQAQTVANMDLAREQNLKIIPVVNKIDLPHAHPEEVGLELVQNFDFNENDIIFTSGKTGEGVSELLDKIIEIFPAPKSTKISKDEKTKISQKDKNETFSALIFDSIFDEFKGVICYIRVLNGELKRDERLFLFNNKSEFNSIEIGIFKPDRISVESLKEGEIGYIATGLRSVREVRVGDTIFKLKDKNFHLEPFPGYSAPQPVVFAGIFPLKNDEYANFKKSLEELALNDAGIFMESTRSSTLGQGFRCGFLGMLHLEVVKERLIREFQTEALITTPSVSVRVLLTDKTEIFIDNPNDLPEESKIDGIFEPMTKTKIYVLNEYYGKVSVLVSENRGVVLETQKIDDKRIEVICKIPLLKLISGFFNDLKSVTSGYASFTYEISHYEKSNMVKMSILIHEQNVEAFESLVYRDEAENVGRRMVEKLKNLIPRHLFQIPIQAAIGSKIVARETISAMRKDVTSKLYGGDQTRKDKLLKKQAEGKKRLKMFGKVSIPDDVFLRMITEK
ncbi:MAG: translation elongation factor 4 [Patescibacteria group bacterium]